MSDLTQTARGPEFQDQLDAHARMGPVVMGPSASHVWRTDPRRLPIILARYKFVSKMFAGKERVLEVGCGDGFQMRLVLQTVKYVHGVDYDPAFIAWAQEQAKKEGLNATYAVADAGNDAIVGTFDGAYSLDVIEHVPPADESVFLRNIARALAPEGSAIIGTPNITATPHASRWSQEGHINLKSAETLRTSLEPHFSSIFLFSMNDEVVHTGYYPMAHYLIALCVGPK